MNILIKIANEIVRRLNHWVQKRSIGNVHNDVFKFVDCLTTVEVVNKLHQTQYLCDIGANAGHWSFVMHQLNPNLEDVVMFEPQSKLIADLEDLDLSHVTKHLFQCALGDKEQILTLTGGTASASLYDIGDNQNHFFPGSTTNESERVNVRILDDIYKNDNLQYPDLIKMDVQGFELNVLNGAENVLSNARYLVIELSLREFYEDQPPLWELWRFLEEHQYTMLDHGYELRSPKEPHELLQFDAIFKNMRFD